MNETRMSVEQLNQIGLQARGPRSYSDPETVTLTVDGDEYTVRANAMNNGRIVVERKNVPHRVVGAVYCLGQEHLKVRVSEDFDSKGAALNRSRDLEHLFTRVDVCVEPVTPA